MKIIKIISISTFMISNSLLANNLTDNKINIKFTSEDKKIKSIKGRMLLNKQYFNSTELNEKDVIKWSEIIYKSKNDEKYEEYVNMYLSKIDRETNYHLKSIFYYKLSNLNNNKKLLNYYLNSYKNEKGNLLLQYNIFVSMIDNIYNNKNQFNNKTKNFLKNVNENRKEIFNTSILEKSLKYSKDIGMNEDVVLKINKTTNDKIKQIKLKIEEINK